MRVVILTSKRRGIASHCLPVLHRHPEIEVAAVIFVDGQQAGSKPRYRRKFKKVLSIGVLGALNGVRLRRWYGTEDVGDIEALATSLGIPFEVSPATNCDRTRELLRKAGADLGVSLSNGYIAESVFTIPRYGMVNVHGEALPRFKGAQSVIWPVYEGCRETGFTIHQISKGIDRGDILYRETFPIKFYPTLRETVEKNVVVIRQRIPARLAHVCARYEKTREKAVRQEPGKSYTTPSIWQFARMLRNHRKFYLQDASLQGAAEAGKWK